MDYDKKFEEMTEEMDDPQTPEDAMMANLNMQAYLNMQRAKTIEFARNLLATVFVILLLPLLVGAWVWTFRYLF